MRKLIIGDLIKHQINKNNIDIEKLVNGLCSITSLKRLINGDTKQSFFLIERILERLGVSVNKIALLHNENDDRLFIIREMINKFLVKKTYDKAEYLLSEFRETIDLNNTIQLQYALEIEAIILYERDKRYEEASDIFDKALRLTAANCKINNVSDFMLGEEEIILLLLREHMDINSNISFYAKQLLNYVESHLEDEEVRTNIYSKLVWILGEKAIRNKRYEESLELTLNGTDSLTDNGLLLHLPQFLDRILFLTKGRNDNLYMPWKKKRDALRSLYLEYDEPWETDEIRIWESYRQNNVYLISELLKDERDLAEYSQEELADVIGIDVKTISRIENGRSNPKKGTFISIKEHFNIERESFQTKLEVDNFFLLEMERDISRLSSRHRYDEAESLFKSLMGQLSKESKVNRQYIMFMEALFDNAFNRKQIDEVLNKLEKAFLTTRTEKHLENLGKFVTTDLEAKIINMMAICYEKLGNRNKSIDLLERLRKGYERNKAADRNHKIPIGLLYTNLCTYYEEINMFDEAISLADKAIKYYIRCNRGDKLGFLVEEKTYTLNRMSEIDANSKVKYRQSYELMELMKVGEEEKAPLREAYKEWYKESINED